MSSLIDFVRRVWGQLKPTEVTKKDDAIRMGILGASQIAPIAVIAPAKSHPEIVIAAVAARDPVRAAAYAKKHKIPIVHQSYDDLLKDPSLDAVYIALPNGLHYEWTLKSLRAGKHVLLEKPCTSNAEEAEKLFNHEILRGPNAPVLLEAFHYRFHPAWQTYLSLIDAKSITNASSSQYLFKGFFNKDDIRFKYALSGGALMDFGTYNVSALRGVFGTEPAEVLAAKARLGPATAGWDQQAEQAITARWRWPNGGVGEIEADLVASGSWGPRFSLPRTEVVQRATLVEDEESKKLPPGQEHVRARKVTILNPLMPHMWHRIEIEDTHTIRSVEDETPIRTWVEKDTMRAYQFPEEGPLKREVSGTHHWTTYRYMLEDFVNKIKGRPVSSAWVTGEESVAQMKVIDAVYDHAGLLLRPTSQFV